MGFQEREEERRQFAEMLKDYLDTFEDPADDYTYTKARHDRKEQVLRPLAVPLGDFAWKKEEVN